MVAIVEDEGGPEKKGLIYEVFVGLSVEKAFGSFPLINPILDQMIADQDIAWPNSETPELIISVTHWGSHEAAKMKFWRIHEDYFEALKGYPKAKFLSVIFDRNPGSDKNLCILIDVITGGCGVSDLNCTAIAPLQKEVKTKKLRDRFGKGKDQITLYSKQLYASSSDFKIAINDLANTIKSLFTSKKIDSELKSILNQAISNSKNNFRDPGARDTYFKQAIIALVDIGKDLPAVFNAYKNENWELLSELLFNKLCSNGCLRENDDSLCVEDYEQTEILDELLKVGEWWCHEQLKNLQKLTNDKQNYLYSYHDHIADIINNKACNKRLLKLLSVNNADTLSELILCPNEGMNRCWPLDYFMAIQRAHTASREFGFQKLSIAASIPYRGAPVSCPLPRFASGDNKKLDKGQINSLSKTMLEYMSTWEASKTNISTIQHDRRITLRKKFSGIDAVLLSKFKEKFLSHTIKTSYRVRHPSSSKCSNVSAGVTEYNFLISSENKQVLIFIAAAYEATHKHKEISGRLRAAYGSGAVKSDDLCLLVIDGNLLSDANRLNRIMMLKHAGWDGAYYLDELPEMIDLISAYFNISKDKKGRIQLPIEEEMPIAAETPTNCILSDDNRRKNNGK